MATKKVEQKTTKKITKKTPTTKTSTTKTVAQPITVVAKTTKPKVVVETKTIKTLPKTTLSPEKKHRKIWKRLFKVLFGLFMIANFILLCLCLKAIKEQQSFTIMSNGGAENYETLKEIFKTEKFQLESTQSINSYYANGN